MRDDAVTYAGSALAHDPANPIYVDTVAFAQHLAGHEHEAAEAYRAALAADPTSYVSANNLAVLLAQDGHRTDAAAVLEDALGVAPDYAIGWHNLGVVQAPASRELLRVAGGAGHCRHARPRPARPRRPDRRHRDLPLRARRLQAAAAGLDLRRVRVGQHQPADPRA